MKSCHSERSHFKDFTVLPVFSLSPRWETAAYFKAECTQLQLLDSGYIVFNMEYKTPHLNSILCATSHPSAIVCSRIPAMFKTPVVSNHCLWVSLAYWSVK